MAMSQASAQIGYPIAPGVTLGKVVDLRYEQIHQVPVVPGWDRSEECQSD